MKGVYTKLYIFAQINHQNHIFRPVTFRCHNLTCLFSCILFSWISLFASNAQVSQNEPKDSSLIENFSIFYQCDSISIDTTYLSNRRQIDRIRHYLMHSPRIDSITIYAWASPEGAYSRNKWLSKERAKSAKAVTPALSVSVSGSGEVTYSRVTRQRSGRNPYTYTITFENVVFTGINNTSVVTASYSHTITNNRGQVTHECSLSGSATIGELKSHPTITMK